MNFGKILSVIKLTLLFAASAQAQSPNFFWKNQDAILSEWSPENFTEAEKFNPKKFRFIFHTVTGWQWPELQKNTPTAMVARDPDYIVNNAKISATVIDQDHRQIFRGGVGLILEIPTSNLIFTAPQDVGSPWFDGLNYSNVYQRMSEFKARKSPELYSPIELLERTDLIWNEIGVMGREPTYGDAVKVRAVVITAKSLDCETNQERSIQNLPWIQFRYILWRCGFGSDWVDHMMDLKKRYPILLMNL